jgi:DUF2971 family protein
MLGFGAIGEFAVGQVSHDSTALTSDILQQVVTKLVNVDMLLPALPPRLHHFTSLGTAAQIIETDNVRLSHAEYSNDQTEMEQAKEIILSTLNSRSSHPFFKQAHTEYEKRVPELDAYIFCMSMDKPGTGLPQDILSQWRAYGQDGRGVALTLGTSQLARMVGNIPNLRINPVIYARSTQQLFVDGILDLGLAAHVHSDPFALDATIAALAFATPLMKASGFEEEHEWRLIFMPPPLDPPPALQFHPRRDFLAPYLNLQYLWTDLRPQMVSIQALRNALPMHVPSITLPLLSIQEVMIGPSGHQTLNVRAFKKLLNQHHLGSVTVERSQIPYRSLG